jgi:flagellar protein FliS
MSIVTKHRLEDMLAATPSRMVIMLYDEAIGALRTSVMAIAAGDIECRCNCVTAVLEIVGHLYLCLDERQGGDVARNLGSIYGHIISRMPMVNLYNDAEVAEEAIGLLEMLRDSWIELDARIADGTADLSIDPAVIAAASQAERAEARNG